MISIFLSVLKNFSFEGRASRKEYWSFVAVVLIAVMALAALGAVTDPNVYSFGILILSFGTFIQSLALAIRRLHDINKSGWYALLSFVPLVGGFIILFFMVSAGNTGINSYGDDPYGQASKIADSAGWKKVS